MAELTAAFLCAALSIPGRLRHAEYLGHWVSILKEDTRAIFSASARATEAATYLEGKGGAVVPETSDTEEEKEEQEA